MLPLWLAQTGGHQAVVDLLLQTGKAEPEFTEYDVGAGVRYASQDFDSTVLKLLLDTGKFQLDTKDMPMRYVNELAPRMQVAEGSDEAVLYWLIENGTFLYRKLRLKSL